MRLQLTYTHKTSLQADLSSVHHAGRARDHRRSMQQPDSGWQVQELKAEMNKLKAELHTLCSSSLLACNFSARL